MRFIAGYRRRGGRSVKRIELSARDSLVDFGRDPTRLELAMQLVTRKFRSRFPPVELVIHAVPWERFDRRPRGHMEIRVFIPSIGVEEKIAAETCRDRREFRGGKRQ